MPARNRNKEGREPLKKIVWEEVWEEEEEVFAKQPSRPIRHLPPGGGFVENTTRTVHRRFLMRPSVEANEAILGCIGRACALYPEVKLAAFWFLSNHYNVLAFYPDELSMRRFMNHLNSNLARELGALHGWREKFWGRRYRAILIVDPEAEVRRLAYLLSQGTKEGLVARPRDWPGVSSLDALLKGRKIIGHWVDRTGLYWAQKRDPEASVKDFTLPYEIPLSPLPAWSDLSVEERQSRAKEIVSMIEKNAARENRRLKRDPMGAAKILRQPPHSHPRNSARSPAPLCHASSRSSFWIYANVYRDFVEEYAELSKLVRMGDLSALERFPAGSFRPPPPPRTGFPLASAVAAGV